MDLLALEPTTLIAMAIAGLGYGLASEAIGALPIPDNTLVGLVFRMTRKIGGKIREKIFGKKE